MSVVKAKPEIVWGDKEAAWDSGKAIMPAYSDSAEYKRPSSCWLSNDLDEHGSGTFHYTKVAVQDDGSRLVVPRDKEEPGYRVIAADRKPKGLTGKDLGFLPKGYHAMTVTYTPKDKRNHEEATKCIYFTVRCRPEIFWDEEYVAMVRSGVPISYEGQLRASVEECPGEIHYSPVDGEVLKLGCIISATFIPLDSPSTISLIALFLSR